MKIALTTSGQTLEAPLESRFGRSPRFLLYDSETGTFTIIANQQNYEAVQGAGIQSAQTIASHGVECLVTGHCGPKAFRALNAAGIKIYNTDATTVAEALRRFNNNELHQAEVADVQGHWQ